MFSKKQDEIVLPEIQHAENEAITSIIDGSMHIEGEITFKGKTRVDGQIIGNITGEHLIVSKSGKVKGDLTLNSFICQGTFEGTADAEIFTARKECVIRGKITANKLTVEPGATIEGEIRTVRTDRAASSSTTKGNTPAAKGAPLKPQLVAASQQK